MKYINDRYYLTLENLIIDEFDINSLPQNISHIYITKDYNAENINNSQYSNNYIENFDINIINKLIRKIKNSGKNIKLVFKLNYEYIDSNFLSQIEDLNFIEFASENYITKISANEILEANNALELFVKDIKESGLSNYEKFLAIYSIVTRFKKYQDYQNDKNQLGYDQSRSIYLVLKNDYMVCVGYSNLLTTLLKLVGINSISYGVWEDSHQLNYVIIQDSKYGINTIIKCDPTSDSGDGDILENKYDYVSIEIPSKVTAKTTFDKYLLNEDINDYSMYYKEIVELYPSIKEDFNKICSYILKLDPSLNGKSKPVLLDEFRKKWFNRYDSKVMLNNKLDAIINVINYISGNKMTEEEKTEEKMNMIKQNSDLMFKLFQQFQRQKKKDEERYKLLLPRITFSDYIKKNDYVQTCIKASLRDFLLTFNNNNMHINLSLNSDSISADFLNLDSKQLLLLSNYFETLNLKVDFTKMENRYKVEFKNIKQDVLLQQALVDISKIVINGLNSINNKNNIANNKNL